MRVASIAIFGNEKLAQHRPCPAPRRCRDSASCVDRVEADHLAGQEEAEHVLLAVGIEHVGLDRAGAHRGDGGERVALAEDVLAFVEGADVLDQHVQVAQRRPCPCPATGRLRRRRRCCRSAARRRRRRSERGAWNAAREPFQPCRDDTQPLDLRQGGDARARDTLGASAGSCQRPSPVRPDASEPAMNLIQPIRRNPGRVRARQPPRSPRLVGPAGLRLHQRPALHRRHVLRQALRPPGDRAGDGGRGARHGRRRCSPTSPACAG